MGEFPGRERGERPYPHVPLGTEQQRDRVRVVEEVSGAVVDTLLDIDISALTQLLSPRNY
jgi:hypothetical protein